jgi:hypothetical protein
VGGPQAFHDPPTRTTADQNLAGDIRHLYTLAERIFTFVAGLLLLLKGEITGKNETSMPLLLDIREWVSNIIWSCSSQT